MKHCTINYYLQAGLSFPLGWNEFVKLPVETRNRYTEAIKPFIDVCQHEWKYTGHTHGGEYYECTICGIEGKD